MKKVASLNIYGLKVDICVSDCVPDSTVVVKDGVTGAVKNVLKLDAEEEVPCQTEQK